MPARPHRRPALAVLAAASVLGALAPAASAAGAPVVRDRSVWDAAMPLVGTTGVYREPILEGGWSGFAPIDADDYWTVSDRGPNGQPKVNGTKQRTFLSPGFTPTIYRVHVDGDGTSSVTKRIPLHLKAGATDPAQAWLAAHADASKAIVPGGANRITGLPQVVTKAQGQDSGLPGDSGTYDRKNARDEVPYAADGTTALPGDPYGLDTEAIAVDPRDGSFWLGDEYRPSLVHVSADGTLLSRIVPEGVSVAADAQDAKMFAGANQDVVTDHPLLPRAFAFRKQNRGMEGATLSRDGKTLFGILQSSLRPPAGGGDLRTLRLVRFDVSDPAKPRRTGEFVYRLDAPRDGTGLAQDDVSVSDIAAIDADTLLVDEHDNVTSEPGKGQKVVYRAELAGATDVGADATQDGEAPTLESTNAAGVTPVAKTPYVDLTALGYDHDKPEGIGLFPDGDLGVQDDNDFGFDQADEPQTATADDPPFRVRPSGKTTELWRIGPRRATPAPGAPGGGAGAGAPGTGIDGGRPVDAPLGVPGGDATAALVLRSTRASRRAALARRAVRLRVRVARRTPTRVTLTARDRGRTVVLGRRTLVLHTGVRTFRVPLRRGGRAVLRRHTSVRVRVALRGHGRTRRGVLRLR